MLWEVSNKWFSAKADFVLDSIVRISVYLRLSTAEWYVVPKGEILSLAFFFCVKADGLAAKLTPERDLLCFRIAACPQVLFEFHKALLKCCF